MQDINILWHMQDSRNPLTYARYKISSDICKMLFKLRSRCHLSCDQDAIWAEIKGYLCCDQDAIWAEIKGYLCCDQDAIWTVIKIWDQNRFAQKRDESVCHHCTSQGAQYSTPDYVEWWTGWQVVTRGSGLTWHEENLIWRNDTFEKTPGVNNELWRK